MSHITNPQVGQTVRFRRHEIAGDPLTRKVGEQVVITHVSDNGRFVTFDGGEGAWSREWFEAVESAPERPRIDFSGPSRETAREYARSLISRANRPDTQRQLELVAAGNEAVDAYDLNVALLDAMRRVGTRFGQSSQRSEHGKRAAYLGHIVQSVLANHADNLPAYAEGQRSRKIEELEKQLAEEVAARGAIQASEGIVRQALRTAQYELDKSTEFAEAKERQLQAAQSVLSRLAEEKAAHDAEREALAEERSTLAAVIAYALERIEDPAEQQRIFGFWDALND